MKRVPRQLNSPVKWVLMHFIYHVITHYTLGAIDVFQTLHRSHVSTLQLWRELHFLFRKFTPRNISLYHSNYGVAVKIYINVVYVYDMYIYNVSAPGPLFTVVRLYIKFVFSTRMFCMGVQGGAISYCGFWCRGLTICLLHVSPRFGNLVIKNGLS